MCCVRLNKWVLFINIHNGMTAINIRGLLSLSYSQSWSCCLYRTDFVECRFLPRLKISEISGITAVYLILFWVFCLKLCWMYLQFRLTFRVLGVIVLEVTLKVPAPPTTHQPPPNHLHSSSLKTVHNFCPQYFQLCMSNYTPFVMYHHCAKVYPYRKFIIAQNIKT
jgi:hypothetical protein